MNKLLKSLKPSIQRLSTEQGWNEGETVRLIVHIFKPKNTEFNAISQLIKDITKYKIKFSFVTINKSHPHFLFDTNQPGIAPKYGNGAIKGEFIPNRASNIFLDSETCIVQMFGANELKTAKHGIVRKEIAVQSALKSADLFMAAVLENGKPIIDWQHKTNITGKLLIDIGDYLIEEVRDKHYIKLSFRNV